MDTAVVVELRAGIVECEHRIRAAVWKGGKLLHAA